MTILLKEYTSDCVFHAQVACEKPISKSIFTELEQALGALKEHIDSGDATYIALSVKVSESPTESYFNDRVAETVDQFYPYTEFSRVFWDAATVDPSMHASLFEFLTKVEEFSSYATREDGGIWYLCEHDEVLFCQPIFFYLAMQDIAFVPYYTRMLSHWRTEEASTWCGEDLVQILENYGLQPETKALVENYIANEGPNMDEFEELLANWG